MTEAQMIEAMARAMCRNGGNNPDAFFAKEQTAMWLDWCEEARAALDAIREHVTIEKETQG